MRFHNRTGVEKEEEAESKVALREHGDKQGADVAGTPYSLDRALYNMVMATRKDRTGGFWTKGTEEDPMVIILTGDGAGLSNHNSGVHFSAVPGTPEYLNQSSTDTVQLLFYKVRLCPLPPGPSDLGDKHLQNIFDVHVVFYNIITPSAGTAYPHGIAYVRLYGTYLFQRRGQRRPRITSSSKARAQG